MTIYTVNVGDIETALISLGGGAKAKEIQDKVIEQFCGGAIPENYKDAKSFRQTIQRKMEDYCPQAVGYDSSKKTAKFLRVGHGLYRLAAGHDQTDVLAVEEVPEAELYVEGATKQIYVNIYERSTKARKQCLDHYGMKCMACNFDFEKVYGEAGKGFIHVHHIVPLSAVGNAYEVNPVQDLRPLCANCHSIVHRTIPALTMDELLECLKPEQ
jgi:5-methylcytosine-specific restriction enzyme A